MARIFGRGLAAALGTGGGGAAVCGAAASMDMEIASGGVAACGASLSGRDGGSWWPLRSADIIARRVMTVECRHGTRMEELRRAMENDMAVEERAEQPTRSDAPPLLAHVCHSHCPITFFLLLQLHATLLLLRFLHIIACHISQQCGLDLSDNLTRKHSLCSVDPPSPPIFCTVRLLHKLDSVSGIER